MEPAAFPGGTHENKDVTSAQERRQRQIIRLVNSLVVEFRDSGISPAAAAANFMESGSRTAATIRPPFSSAQPDAQTHSSDHARYWPSLLRNTPWRARRRQPSHVIARVVSGS